MKNKTGISLFQNKFANNDKKSKSHFKEKKKCPKP